MNKFSKLFAGTILATASSIALAAPSELVVDNKTDYQARAYVHGISKNPAEAHSSMSLNWWALSMVCAFQTECKAEVKVKTDTANPISLGNVSINLDTGVIDTSGLSHAEGFNVSYVAPGHAVVTQG